MKTGNLERNSKANERRKSTILDLIPQIYNMDREFEAGVTPASRDSPILLSL